MQVGYDKYLVDRFLRELGVDIEGAYALYFVAESVDAVGQVRREGVDIDNAAPDGKLSRFIDIVDPFEAVAREKVGNVGEVAFLAFGQPQGVAVQLFVRGHLFAQSLGVGNHEKRRAGLLQTVDGVGAENVGGGVDLSVFQRPFVARGEEEYPFVAPYLGQVVVEIACLFGVVGNEQDGGSALGNPRE